MDTLLSTFSRNYEYPLSFLVKTVIALANKKQGQLYTFEPSLATTLFVSRADGGTNTLFRVFRGHVVFESIYFFLDRKSVV